MKLFGIWSQHANKAKPKQSDILRKTETIKNRITVSQSMDPKGKSFFTLLNRGMRVNMLSKDLN